MTSLWSQRSTNVPAIGLRSRFGSVATKNTSADREGGAGRDRDHGDERDLVEPVAEQRDELARPQRRERAVEREPDVGVAADALEASGGCGMRDRGGRRGAAGRCRPSHRRLRRAAIGERRRGGAGAAEDQRPSGGAAGAGRGRAPGRVSASPAVVRPQRASRRGRVRRADVRIAASCRARRAPRDADDGGEEEERETGGRGTRRRSTRRSGGTGTGSG